MALAPFGGDPGAVIVVQRVRVRWGADARGATDADRRRAIPEVYPLPDLPADEPYLVHDIFADAHSGYRPIVMTRSGESAVRDAWLQAQPADDGILVQRLPGSDAFPALRYAKRLFTLKPGQVGRYRANFRCLFTQCACAPFWYYESWTVSVAYAAVRPDLFTSGVAVHEVDHRVHLYGGTRRRGAR